MGAQGQSRSKWSPSSRYVLALCGLLLLVEGMPEKIASVNMHDHAEERVAHDLITMVWMHTLQHALGDADLVATVQAQMADLYDFFKRQHDVDQQEIRCMGA